jgi:hypothetical protein
MLPNTKETFNLLPAFRSRADNELTTFLLMFATCFQTQEKTFGLLPAFRSRADNELNFFSIDVCYMLPNTRATFWPIAAFRSGADNELTTILLVTRPFLISNNLFLANMFLNHPLADLTF